MLIAIQEEGCGFVGCAFTGLSYIDDVRPDEQKIEFWIGQLSRKWLIWHTAVERWRLHNGANIYHPATLRLNSDRQRKYRIAWVCSLRNVRYC